MDREYYERHSFLTQLKKYPRDKLVFWVGAGIDIPAPTNLPSGQEMLEFFLKHTCGTKETLKLFDIWKDNERFIREQITNNFSSVPRLETVIDELLTCEENLQHRKSFFKGILSFCDAPPNKTHFILAQLLAGGANIVTTNFELCIQKAFCQIYKGEQMLLKEHTVIPEYYSTLKDSGSLYYIHGNANNLDTLGATLKQLKQGFDKQVADMFDTWIEQDYCFVFLGYSGSDSFDVNRYFLSKKNKTAKAKGIYIRHSTETVVNSKPREKEKLLLDVFGEKYVIQTDTSCFMEQFVLSAVDAQESLFHYEWKQRFLDIADELTPEVKATFLVSLCGILGIDIDKIGGSCDWVERAENRSVFTEWYIDYACYRMASRQGDSHVIERYMNNIQRYDKAAYLEFEKRERAGRYMQDDTYLCATDLLLEDINRMIAERKIIDWDVSAPLNQTSVMVINYMLAHSLEEALEKYAEYIETVRRCYKKIIGLDYSCFSELHQLHCAQRYYACLLVMVRDDYEVAEELLKDSTYYYAEIGRLDGIIANLLSRVLIEMIHFYYSGDIECQNRISEVVKQAEKLIEVNSYKRYKKMLRRYLVFYDRMK